MKPRDVIRQYHEATKHTPERLRSLRHHLDWANQPNPFRHYAGAPIIDLPADAPAPTANLLALLRGEIAEPLNGTVPRLLSALLFHAAAISATRVSPAGTRYALRVNPSSGNLHPTEFHFSAHGLAAWPDGVYHYRPSQHTAEQRAKGTLTEEPLRFLLTTIAWREAWKYRDRAYRYCLIDVGHAVEALVTAGRALGWDFTLATEFDDDAVAAAFHLADDEWPMALVTFHGVPAEARESSDLFWEPCAANQLSPDAVEYPSIQQVHQATKLHRQGSPHCYPQPGAIQLPPDGESAAPFAATVRGRRSALDFTGGEQSITLAQLAMLLHAATGANLYVRLWLFVHRVTDLAPGLYRYDQWSDTLDIVKAGDQRVMAAALSLAQDLAGNSVVTIALTGALDSGYRDLHIEAGRLGHRLYLAAEALGLAATGIGAFYDAAVMEQLGEQSAGDDVVYHFAVGYAVVDQRHTESSDTLPLND